MAEKRVRSDAESSSPEVVYERSSSERTDINEYGLAFNEIREEKINEEGQDSKRQRIDKTYVICDVCLIHFLAANLSKSLVFYLCYVCERYICENCYKGHDESHECISVLSGKSKRDRQIESFLDEMREESEREEQFMSESVSMVDRVNVKLDQRPCGITGLCGLDDSNWVVSDNYNSCIKIFHVVSNLLQRYLRLGSNPWDVTEIKVKSESTEQGDTSAVDISVTNQGKQDKQSLIAVTFPLEKKILILDVTKNPAVITNTIQTEKQCRSIEFSGDHLFTICKDRNGPLSIFVTSINGVAVRTINTAEMFGPIWSYLAVCSGRFYLTDPSYRKVLCLNDEGNKVSDKTIEGSQPVGISVDPDTNHLYICDAVHHKVLRLDSGLESSEILFDLRSVNSEKPRAMCLHRNKLYVSHCASSTLHKNCVTVVRVL